MGSRTLPTDCPHGRTLDWGDFGPGPGDGTVGAEHCPECQGPPTPAGPFVVAGTLPLHSGRRMIPALRSATVHAELGDAQASADAYNERHRRTWPDSGVRYVVCSLVPIEPLEGEP